MEILVLLASVTAITCNIVFPEVSTKELAWAKVALSPNAICRSAGIDRSPTLTARNATSRRSAKGR